MTLCPSIILIGSFSFLRFAFIILPLRIAAKETRRAVGECALQNDLFERMTMGERPMADMDRVRLSV